MEKQTTGYNYAIYNVRTNRYLEAITPTSRDPITVKKITEAMSFDTKEQATTVISELRINYWPEFMVVWIPDKLREQMMGVKDDEQPEEADGTPDHERGD